MDLKLKGKRALVTGSTRGIGKAIAASLAREGAALAVHGRRRDDALRTAEEISASAATALPAAGDLTTEQGARETYDAAVDALGGVDILVNNAGTFEVCGWAHADACSRSTSAKSRRNSPSSRRTWRSSRGRSGSTANRESAVRPWLERKPGARRPAVLRAPPEASGGGDAAGERRQRGAPRAPRRTGD